MIKILIKPLSVNDCWQGRRLKTNKYKIYEVELLYKKLPNTFIIPDGELEFIIEVGFSNRASDIDNICKPILDILQKKYHFNDNKIYRIIMTKKIVKKTQEYIKFDIKKYNQ